MQDMRIDFCQKYLCKGKSYGKSAMLREGIAVFS